MLPLDYEADIRFKCLRLSIKYNYSDDAETIIQEARKFSDFVLGTSDTEIICADRELAEKVKN